MDNKYLVIDENIKSLNKNNVNLNELPLVSFCIPTFNSSRTLKSCLKSIKRQKYPKIEIIIVDNGSTDDTLKIAEGFTDKIYFDDGLLGSVRQTSVEKSNGKIIALFDSDIIIPHENWLSNAVTYFNYSDHVSTVWPVNIAPPESPLSTKLYFNLWKMSMDYRIKKGRSYFGGGNALFWRNCIDEIGGINRSLHWGEDFEWSKKFKEKNYQVILLKDPLYHDTMPSVKEFTRKQFIASETFSKTGFELMGLSAGDLFYENFILGTSCMVKNLIFKKDYSWALFPLFLSARCLGYSYALLRNLVKTN